MKKIVSFLAATALVATLMTTQSCTKTCDAGYEGSDCKTLMSTKFLGSWLATDHGSVSGNHSYTVTITQSSTNNVTLLLQNFAAAGSTCTFHGTVSASNAVTFANETVCGFTISNGTGTISSDGRTITVSFGITDGVTPETETGTWAKQ